MSWSHRQIWSPTHCQPNLTYGGRKDMAAFYIQNQLIVIHTAGLNAPFCSDLEVTEVGQKLTRMLTFWSVRMVDIYGCWNINLLRYYVCLTNCSPMSPPRLHTIYLFFAEIFFFPFIHACSRYIWNAIAIMPTCKPSSALRPPKRTQKIRQSHMQSPAINTKWMLLMSACVFINFSSNCCGITVGQILTEEEEEDFTCFPQTDSHWWINIKPTPAVTTECTGQMNTATIHVQFSFCHIIGVPQTLLQLTPINVISAITTSLP